jgi:hypothetical protein
MLDAARAAGEGARERSLRDFVASLDEEELSRRYREDDGVIVLPRLLPRALVDEMVAEARRLLPRAVRKRVPFLRKAGALSNAAIVREAPAMCALHWSPAMLGLFERVTGVPLEHRDPREPHASALYTYSKRGDWMDWHYDECGCAPEDSFSTVVGLIDDSSSRLEIETRRDRPGQAPLQRSVHTVPGTFAFFCGTRAYHRVTPLGKDELRVTFTFTYIRKGRKPGGIYNLRLKLGNALVYFGLGHLFERKAPVRAAVPLLPP